MQMGTILFLFASYFFCIFFNHSEFAPECAFEYEDVVQYNRAIYGRALEDFHLIRL